ncbi:MAG: hydrogenase maturation protease [Syntrophomonadaceae bacterium]|nr:hydrogenase maturation protease [Syntrophomonadaceae bacterium]
MRCLVLGCGNLLAADDAIGLWVVRYLKELATKKEPADQEASINEFDGQKPSGQAPASGEDPDKLGEVGSDSGQALTASREKKIKLPPGTVVLEVGTPGLNLLNYWAPEDRVILVDAIRSGRPPGTIQRLTLTELLSIERGNNLTVHGLGIIEALELARLTDNLPAELVLIGIEIANEEPFQIGLSPAVERAIVPAAEMVQAELSRFYLS